MGLKSFRIKWRFALSKVVSAILAFFILACLSFQWADLTRSETLQEWESRQSERNWLRWDQELRDSMAETVGFIDNLDIDVMVAEAQQRVENLNVESSKEFYRQSIERISAQHRTLLHRLDNVRDQQIYRRYLHAFVREYRRKSATAPRTLGSHFIWASAKIDSVREFLDNIEYSLKIEEEFGVTMSHASRNFIRSNIRAMYDDLHSIPPFVVRNSGLKQISLREIMPGAVAQMSQSEMAGKFDSYSAYVGVVLHELTHALDSNQGLGRNDAGWLAVNQEAEPYAFAYGSQAIETADPTQPSLSSPMPAYAERYGQQGGILEDKATISEHILTGFNIERLVERAIADPILKRKIEFMSGYHLDFPFSAKHGRELTKQEAAEYKSFAGLAKNLSGKVFDDNPLQAETLNRLVTDCAFRKGAESIQGRKIVIVYGFGTPVTNQEYLDAGFPGREYWSKWSKDSEGRVWLDAEYYNGLLRRSFVIFTEENGQTKRIIKPQKNFV